VFKVDYVVEAAGNKEFGSVFLQQGNEKENVAVSVVQNGWAKVGSSGWCCVYCQQQGAWHSFAAGAGCAKQLLTGQAQPPWHLAVAAVAGNYGTCALLRCLA
jgi:hypothetical protein